METHPSPNASEDTSIPSTTPVTVNSNRLSIPYAVRVSVVTIGGFITGMFLGVSYATQIAALRFRAENAHRLPSTTTGWYLYHKSKNYRVMLGGLKEGFKMGPKVALWSGGFIAIEEAVDNSRGKQDFMSTAITGFAIAGGFSLWNRFPVLTAVRTVKLGLYTGLGFGLLQDALSIARGRRLEYVDFLSGRNRQLDHIGDRVI